MSYSALSLWSSASESYALSPMSLAGSSSRKLPASTSPTVVTRAERRSERTRRVEDCYQPRFAESPGVGPPRFTPIAETTAMKDKSGTADTYRAVRAIARPYPGSTARRLAQLLCPATDDRDHRPVVSVARPARLFPSELFPDLLSEATNRGRHHSSFISASE